MQKIGFNDNWQFHKQGYTNTQTVILPHDAMIHEAREPDGTGGSGHGYFPGGIYVYEKTFTAPAEWAEGTISLLFEGVYKNSTVTVNGKTAGGQPYGYTPFTVCLAMSVMDAVISSIALACSVDPCANASLALAT